MDPTRMSMELSIYFESWAVTYLGDLQPTYIGVIIYLLSSMDIPDMLGNPKGSHGTGMFYLHLPYK